MAEALRALLPELEGAVAPAPAVAPPAALYTPTRKEQGAVATPALAAPEPSPAPRRSRLPLVALVLALLTFGVTVAALMTWKPAGEPPLVIEVPPEKPKPAPEVPLPPEPVAPSPPVAEPPPPPPPAVQQVAKNKPKPVPRAPEPVKPVEPEPRKPQNGVTMIETGRDRKTTPPDFDAKRFELFGYLPKAKEKALEMMSDAVLINMDVEGVGPDGTANLALSPAYEANYFFRSPSRSKVDGRLPARDQEIACKVYVVVKAKSVETFVTTSSDGCREKALPPWKCTMAEAVKRAQAEGAKAGPVGKVTYLADGTWMFDQGDGAGETVYFSCP
ncbi:MAG: hypothetical protein JNK82_35065 [Myxococcaceae bacterium]|nr:hypothetical protein [Myxococcaceae bacterium]